MSFTKLSKKKQPNKVVVDLIYKFDISKTHKALDVGAGPLIETKFLIDNNFHVSAVDMDLESQNTAQSINNKSLYFQLGKIQNIDILKNEFDLVLSFNTLSFLPQSELLPVFNKMSDSLKNGGYMVISFFGNRDDWAKKENDLTFLNKNQVENLFDKSFEIERFIEEDKKGMTVTKTIKHWHIFTVVAKKIL